MSKQITVVFGVRVVVPIEITVEVDDETYYDVRAGCDRFDSDIIDVRMPRIDLVSVTEVQESLDGDGELDALSAAVAAKIRSAP